MLHNFPISRTRTVVFKLQSHQNHLEDILKHPHNIHFSKSGVGPKSLHKFPGGADATGPGMTLRAYELKFV